MASDVASIKRELAQADLFFEWDELLLELIASVTQEKTYQRGQYVFDETSISNELYIVAEGEVEIQVKSYGESESEKRQTIATLRRGQNFGEVALLDQGRRTAAAQCVQMNTHLLVIPSAQIILMCENVPRLGYLLMRNIAADLAMKIRSTDIEIQARMWQPHAAHPT